MFLCLLVCLFLGVWACLAVLDFCLQAATPVEEEILLAVVATMLEWRNSKEEWFLFNRFVCVCISAERLQAWFND